MLSEKESLKRAEDVTFDEGDIADLTSGLLGMDMYDVYEDKCSSGGGSGGNGGACTGGPGGCNGGSCTGSGGGSGRG